MFEETPDQRRERLKQRALELAIASFGQDGEPLVVTQVTELADKYYEFISS